MSSQSARLRNTTLWAFWRLQVQKPICMTSCTARSGLLHCVLSNLQEQSRLFTFGQACDVWLTTNNAACLDLNTLRCPDMRDHGQPPVLQRWSIQARVCTKAGIAAANECVLQGLELPASPPQHQHACSLQSPIHLNDIAGWRHWQYWPGACA